MDKLVKKRGGIFKIGGKVRSVSVLLGMLRLVFFKEKGVRIVFKVVKMLRKVRIEKFLLDLVI